MNIKDYSKLYYILGIIYLLFIIPGILLFYGGIFLFDDPRTMESTIANIFFLISSTFSLVLFISGVSCLMHKKIINLIGNTWFKLIVILPIIEIILFITILVITEFYCGGDFCI